MMRRVLCGALVTVMVLWGGSVQAGTEIMSDVEWEFWLEKEGEKTSEFWLSDEMTFCALIENTGDEVIQNPTVVITVEVKDIEVGPTYIFAILQTVLHVLGRVVPAGLVLPRGQMVVEVPESIEPGKSYLWSKTYIAADLVQELVERRGRIEWRVDKETGKGSMKFKHFPLKYIMPTPVNFDLDKGEVLLSVKLHINNESTEPQKYGFSLKE